LCMSRQLPLPKTSEAKHLEEGEPESNHPNPLNDVLCKRLAIVNVAFIGGRGARSGEWVLIDAGVPGSSGAILKVVSERFGGGSKPAAIILTHGHFDHVGVLKELAEEWDVPIYAHVLEHPYLNGTERYSKPDPKVGGGLMATMSPLYPRGPVDVKKWLQQLPEGGDVPVMPGWKWIHTPGHTRGHVSFWRESDRMLITGDAFITTNQESAYAVATQRLELHGPPMYYTADWDSARESVRKLAALEPEYVVTGHGRPMQGNQMRAALRLLAHDFDRIAMPDQGHYVKAA